MKRIETVYVILIEKERQKATPVKREIGFVNQKESRKIKNAKIDKM